MARRQKRLQQRRRARPKRREAHPIRALGSGLAVATLAGLLGWVWWAGQAPQHPLPDPPSWLPKCPVGGGPVNFAHRVSTPDGPVYFCCEHCVERFREEPLNYATQIDEQRVILASLPRIQVTCPVSGDPVDPDVYAESDGHSVQFCSPRCRAVYLETPVQYRADLAGCYWYQTKCPIDARPIDPRFFETFHAAETVYFCSSACRHKFSEDPTRFAGELARQGIRLHF